MRFLVGCKWQLGKDIKTFDRLARKIMVMVSVSTRADDGTLRSRAARHAETHFLPIHVSPLHVPIAKHDTHMPTVAVRNGCVREIFFTQ